MENASKALIMAASVILGVLLFSVFVYVFRAGASLDETYDAAQNLRQINLYNSYFEVYDRNDNSILDIITVANRAYSVNKDVGYDETLTMKIIIKIGNKCYVIPNTKTEPPMPASTDEKTFSRNKIYEGDETGETRGDPFSIYNLLELTLEELGISGTNLDKNDKLSISKLGTIKYTDALGKPQEKKNATVYKYIFKRTDIDYDLNSGRIRYMKFEVDKNTNWDP